MEKWHKIFKRVRLWSRECALDRVCLDAVRKKKVGQHFDGIPESPSVVTGVSESDFHIILSITGPAAGGLSSIVDRRMKPDPELRIHSVGNVLFELILLQKFLEFWGIF